jgi:hypothetical protein
MSTLAAPPAVVAGNYEGWMDLGKGQRASIGLRLLPGGGGLVDLPDQDLYGYPLSSLVVDGDHLAFFIGTEGDGAIHFEAHSAPARKSAPSQPSILLEGSYGRQGSTSPFALGFVESPAKTSRKNVGEAFDVAVRGGQLRGSLLLPEGRGPWPLAVIIAGAGTTDRDGNNYAVPGRNDALRQLAQGLAASGVASYRYDKRGAGESYVLAGEEAASRFDDYVEDAVAVVRGLAADPRFSRLLLVGHTEGALVATATAAALSAAGQDDAVGGLALLCAPGYTGIETVRTALADTPAELKGEAAAIMKALAEGRTYPDPSPYFADFFRPSFQPWLLSWFSHDIKTELARYKGPVLLVAGDRDMQAGLGELAILARARPDAAAAVLHGMNHALKAVSQDPEENYRAFSDPALPLAPGLVDLVSAFAAYRALPEVFARLDGGRLPGR